MSKKCLDQESINEILTSIRNLEDKDFSDEVSKIQKDLKGYVEEKFNLSPMQKRIFAKTSSNWWEERGDLLAFTLKYGHDIDIKPNQQGAKCKWKLSFEAEGEF